MIKKVLAYLYQPPLANAKCEATPKGGSTHHLFISLVI